MQQLPHRQDTRSLDSLVSFILVFILSTKACSASKIVGRKFPTTFHCNAPANRPLYDAGAHWDDSSLPIAPTTSNRRRFLESISTTAAATVGVAPPHPSFGSYVDPDIDCLLDLPPPSDDVVRVYLCRHGETENNRLHLLQGVRVNAPINGRGIAQSTRLGMAFDRLADPDRPRVVLHSGLARSTQTAAEAVRVMTRRKEGRVRLAPLTSLRSMDYGPLAGGREASEVRAGMARTYGAWTAGYLDTRPDGGGESGCMVLNRAAATLRSLAQIAKYSGESVLAVSHSSYLRVLLAIILEKPLELMATVTQHNGCINVVDLRRDGSLRTLRPMSTIFYEAPKKFKLHVPVGSAVRINEIRHLNDICRFIPSEQLPLNAQTLQDTYAKLAF